jgi:hypothetical protein
MDNSTKPASINCYAAILNLSVKKITKSSLQFVNCFFDLWYASLHKLIIHYSIINYQLKKDDTNKS